MCEESQLCQYSGSHRVEGLENGDYKAGYFRGAKGVCPAPVIDFPPSPRKLIYSGTSDKGRSE